MLCDLACRRKQGRINQRQKNSLACPLGIWFKAFVRQGRLKAPESHPVAYYHCISRTVHQQFLFGEREKEQFVKWMREYETFCGVRIITYEVLSNHFHIEVEVPHRPEVLPTDEELCVLVEGLTMTGENLKFRETLERLRGEERHEEAKMLRERYLARMWDISQFMKALKQRFTQWYNATHDRVGTLWESRFKSELVEGRGEAVAVMAAYIDLNCVRAGIVRDPKDYRWSGYSEAMAGNQRALQGLRVVVAAKKRVAEQEIDIGDVLKEYRVWLFCRGEENDGFDQDGKPLRLGISSEKVAEVMAAKGEVSQAEYLHQKVRYFIDGVALGSRGFVEEIFHTYRDRFGPRRKNGARKLRGLANAGLYTMRDLRLRVFG